MTETLAPVAAKQGAAAKPAAPKAAKSAKPAKPTKAAAPVATEVKVEAKAKKEKKTKVIRDSFTLPQDDYAKIAELKQACLKAGLHVKKSELIRAGLRLLSKLDSAQLHAELDGLEKIKTGRPKSA